MFGTPVVLNVDGLDRKRSKWNTLGQQVLHFCEWMSSFSSNRLVTDAKTIHDYYVAKYGADSTVIGYGSEMPTGDYNLNGFNLQPGRYVLYVSRLEPENNPELVLRSWRQVQTDWPLVMVGDNAYEPSIWRACANWRTIALCSPVRLWRRILGAAEACGHLRFRLRNRRRASGADRSHGRAKRYAVPRYSGEPRDRRRCRSAVHEG